MTALRPFLFLHIESRPRFPAGHSSAQPCIRPGSVVTVPVQAILFGSAAIAVSTPGPPQKRCTARTRNLLYFGISTTYGGSMLMCEV